MSVIRILVWTANFAAVGLLWSVIAGEPSSRHQQRVLAFVASVMSLTLAYVWVLEAARRNRGGKD